MKGATSAGKASPSRGIGGGQKRRIPAIAVRLFLKFSAHNCTDRFWVRTQALRVHMENAPAGQERAGFPRSGSSGRGTESLQRRALEAPVRLRSCQCAFWTGAPSGHKL